MNREQTGRIIARFRREKGMTQRDLADALGISNKAVSKWETGQGMPDIELLERMSDVFGVPIDVLIRGVREGDAPDGEEPVLFECRSTVTGRRLILWARLRDRLVFPSRRPLVRALAGVLLLLSAALGAGMLFTLEWIVPAFFLPPALLTAVLAALAPWVYWTALHGRSTRTFPPAYGKEVRYTFTESGVTADCAGERRTISYSAVGPIVFGEHEVLLCADSGAFLIGEGDFSSGEYGRLRDFLTDRCPEASCSPVRVRLRVFRPLG